MVKLFKTLHRAKKSKARLGEIRTGYGVIKTPAFVPVATKGTLKALSPNFIKNIGIQVAFVNTYHLVTHPGCAVIEKAGGIHKFANLNIPLMSDSGGFQVFSLASPKRQPTAKAGLAKSNRISRKLDTVFFDRLTPKGPQAIVSKKVSSLSSGEKIKHFQADVRGDEEPLVIKISDDGVKFRSTYDGKLIEFTPEKSMEYQRKIGADLLMAFDECTYYPSTHEYAQKAMERTHQWLERCIAEIRRLKVGVETGQEDRKKRSERNFSSNFQFPNSLPNPISKHQFLYGIIHGGIHEDLRKKSAEFVVSQPVDGVAIGGVAVGESKKEMRKQVCWVSDYLPKNRPVHLLGVGQFDDIIDLVKYGIDTFDCVEPTRLGRMGRIYQWRRVLSRVSLPQRGSLSTRATHRPDFDIDIFKGIYKNDLSPVDEGCNCYVCTNFTKAYLHHLFKQKEILGYTLATYHNLWVMERFFDKIRKAISEDKI